jgi:hypothetical protein
VAVKPLGKLSLEEPKRGRKEHEMGYEHGRWM